MIQRRPFGRTGHASSVMLFGAAALARASQDDADRALETLLRHGVNHIDRAARYGGSELRIGPPLWRPAAGPRHRAGSHRGADHPRPPGPRGRARAVRPGPR